MAPSLRDLIDFLLAEIALCGDQGASPADVLSFIDVFYSQSAKDASDRCHSVDRKFQEKVWQWLTKNPEVSVGKNREGNFLALADVEHDQLETQETQRTQHGSESSPKQEEDSLIRVFVSKERTWLAVTGHEPDETKVLPTEFALLSIIASRKSDGIVQTELVKLSGQDKRSVPKRTEVLQQKGYIEKRAIQIKSARTSLCTLRRFLKPENRSNETPAQGSAATDDKNKMIDFNQFTTKLFEILREYKLISRADLKNLLGFADPWRWRILSRALRKFERIGVLKRVKAQSQYADTMRKFHPCIMLIRDPTEKDIEMFHEFSQNIYTNLENGGNTGFDEDLEAEDAAGEPSSTDHVDGVGEGGSVEESGRILPLWNPDRTIHNQIFDVVDSTGVLGTSNSEVIRACFGGFYRRPLENTLARLVECWQMSQPSYLRHLAIVRDTALNRTITHYVHYTARNFSKLVEAGEASWEAVEFIPKNSKLDPIRVPPIEAKPQLDAYGLPLDAPKKELLKDGNASLLECMLVVKPPDYLRSSSDAMAIKMENGTFAIHFGHKRLLPGMTERIRSSEPSLRNPQAIPTRPKLEYEGISDVNMEGGGVQTPKRSKKPKRESERFLGMSEKEKLEAMGLDESWTEYSVLIAERPNPGVYITPKGRRRPAGKRQGRPRISRIAVFKSSRLPTLPWFEPEQDQNSEVVGASKHLTPQDNAGKMATTVSETWDSAGPRSHLDAPVTRGVKRDIQQRISGGDSDPGTLTASKLRRTSRNNIGPNNDLTVLNGGENTARAGKRKQKSVDKSQRNSQKGVKRRRVGSPDIQENNIDIQDSPASHIQPAVAATDQGSDQVQLSNETQNMETPSKRSRRGAQKLSGRKALLTTVPNAVEVLESSARTEKHKENPSLSPPRAGISLPTPEPVQESLHESTPTAMDLAAEDGAPSISESIRNKPDEGATTNVQSLEPSESNPTHDGAVVSNIPKPPGEPTPEAKRSKAEKGGTVAFLRRSIVMDIIEKAGGAYPMGTEIWYPFMTAWMRTKYKEKPDLRTIKTTIKHMVDAGKLRQQTFCGRDKKGVMVTKTVICKSDMEPDDPIVKSLQNEMLNCETRYYFPPNVEIDPELTKGGNKATPGKESKPSSRIPVESGLTVQLHQKPAAVLAIEKRRGQSIQRRLLQRIDMERAAAGQERSGVVRLLKIRRADADNPLLHGMTSISRPDHVGNDEKKRVARRRRSNGQVPAGGPRRMKRTWKPISSMAPYAMLMNPRQFFHPSTGTFSTHAGVAALRAPKYPPKQGPHLPNSLDDLFDQTRRRSVKDSADPQSKKFFRDNNTILRWELQHEELLQKKNTASLRYINQTVPEAFVAAPVEGAIRFDDGWRQERAPPPSMVTRQVFRRSPSVDESSSSRSTSLERDVEAVLISSPPDDDRSRNTIPRNRRLEKLNEFMAASEPSTEALTPSSRQILRRNRLGQSLPQPMMQRIMTAIVVVRALAGGLDGRIVDWALVTHCFPGQDPKTIQDKGKGILNKHRLQLSKMQSDFQERFAEAYATGQVPSINYDDLDSYDWATVVEWANTQLDIPKSTRVPDLPATRQQFDGLFELREDALTSVDDIYQGNQSITVGRKRALFASVPYATPLENKLHRNPARQADLSRVEVAKTWIRANVVTPEPTYRPAEARDSLSYFGNKVLGSALQSLIAERVISQGNRGRITPGRNYDITEHFLHALSKKRAIEGTELRRASRFKTNTLDPALASQGVFDITYGAEDGDILAAINLYAEGRVTLHPRDAPRDRFGLTDGGYLTRQMNKDKLRFPVEVRPVSGLYVAGDPIQEKASTIPPPCTPTQIATTNPMLSVPEKIPLWYDIHGQFIKVLWELAVAAAVGCVATRPGITAEGISSMVKPTMGAWEIQPLLQWMTNVGIMRQEGCDVKGEPGWVVQEWWWMILG